MDSHGNEDINDLKSNQVEERVEECIKALQNLLSIIQNLTNLYAKFYFIFLLWKPVLH